MLVTNELVGIQDFVKITNSFRGIRKLFYEGKIERCQHETSWSWRLRDTRISIECTQKSPRMLAKHLAILNDYTS